MNIMEKSEKLNKSFKLLLEDFDMLNDSLFHLNEIVKKSNDSEIKIDTTECLQSLTSIFHSVKEASNTVHIELNHITTYLQSSVNWVSKDNLKNLTFIEGNTPWSIWLAYPNSEIEVNIINNELRKRHLEKKMQKLKIPKVGDYIACYAITVWYRGVITAIGKNWVKVLNIDQATENFVKDINIYEIPTDIAKKQAYTIQVSLTKDQSFENKWDDGLKTVFKNNILKECSRFNITMVEQILHSPHLFYVKIDAFKNESTKVELNNWLSKILIRALDGVCYSDITEGYADEKEPYENIGVIDYLQDKDIDPFYDYSVAHDRFPEMEKVVKIVTCISESPSVQSDPESFESQSLDENIIFNEKPINRFLYLMSASGEDSSQSILKIPHYSLGSSSEDKIISCKHSHSEDDVGSTCSFIQSPDKDSKDDNHFTSNILNHDRFFSDATFSLEKLDVDKNRICDIYSKKSFCWKPGCRKEHKKANDDKNIQDLTSRVEVLDLPPIGSIVKLKVSHVVLRNAFYALLVNDYSASNKDKTETSDMLIKKLNLPEIIKTFRLFITPPCLGKLLIAYSKVKTLWLRAVGRDVSEDNESLEVFFVDFGFLEVVKIVDCRQIDEQYLHLPYQAVYCTLSDIYPHDDEESETLGKSYLKKLLLDQEIDAKVIDVDFCGNRMEIIAYHKSADINQLLNNKHQPYCLRLGD